jgi:hypothetical protein
MKLPNSNYVRCPFKSVFTNLQLSLNNAKEVLRLSDVTQQAKMPVLITVISV